MKVKIFHPYNYDSNRRYELLELAVNDFISQEEINVIDIKPINTGTENGADSLLVIYTTEVNKQWDNYIDDELRGIF